MLRRRTGLVLLLLLALGCSRDPSPSASFDSLDADLGTVADFSLTDQDGRTVRRADLLGKVWVASFVFTRCPGECVVITRNLGVLQKQLGRQEDVMLVSFTVDPKHDTSEVLHRYAEAKGADPRHWLFLTGKPAEIDALVIKSFFQPIERRETGDASRTPSIMHSPRLVVVDADGRIRGYINGTNPDEYPALRRKIRWLVLEKYDHFPTINGALNGLSGLLLVLGFVAIRARRVAAHKALMLAALAVSVVFLGCYLYYHFAILGGHPTGFPGEGWVRPAYFAVLLSHTLLAVVVAPLALITAYRGLRGRLAGHVRLAWWTWPLWLYVSVTGVLVYWMRYHLYP